MVKTRSKDVRSKKASKARIQSLNAKSLPAPPYPPPMLIPLTLKNKVHRNSKRPFKLVLIKKLLVRIQIIFFKSAAISGRVLVNSPKYLFVPLRSVSRKVNLFFVYLSKKPNRVFGFVGCLLIIFSIIAILIKEYNYSLILALCAVVQFAVGQVYRLKWTER